MTEHCLMAPLFLNSSILLLTYVSLGLATNARKEIQGHHTQKTVLYGWFLFSQTLHSCSKYTQVKLSNQYKSIHLECRVQEGLYITHGFSSPKFLTPTSYLGQVKQPMQQKRFRGRIQERLDLTEGFSSPKSNKCQRIDLEAQYWKDSPLLMAFLS